MSCSLASATTRSKNDRSTHCAVGLLGKPRIIILGLGIDSRTARSSSSKKSMPGVMRTERMLAPAITAP
ncbi:Uncharacterised protein [Bordetella pertussis]|nr:Uncharacterised protein [Bordetella pertussis]CPM49850.1 Uncharacterised protein [Bordetella pertussis]